MAMDWPWSHLKGASLRKAMEEDLPECRKEKLQVRLPKRPDMWVDSSVMSAYSIDKLVHAAEMYGSEHFETIREPGDPGPTVHAADLSWLDSRTRANIPNAQRQFFRPRWNGHGPDGLYVGNVVKAQGQGGAAALFSWLQGNKALLFPSTQVKAEASTAMHRDGVSWEMLMVDCPPGQQYKHSVMLRMRQSTSEAGWPACCVYVEPGSWQDKRQAEYPGAHVSVFWRIGSPPKGLYEYDERALPAWMCTYSTYYNKWTHREWVERYEKAHPARGMMYPAIDPEGNQIGELELVRVRANSYDKELFLEERKHWENGVHANADINVVKAIMPPALLLSGDNVRSTGDYENWEWESVARGTMIDMPAIPSDVGERLRDKFNKHVSYYRDGQTDVKPDWLYCGFLSRELGRSETEYWESDAFYSSLNCYPTFMEVVQGITIFAAFNNPVSVVKTVSRKGAAQVTGERGGRAGGVKTRNLFIHSDTFRVKKSEPAKSNSSKPPGTRGPTTYKGTMPLQKVPGYRQRKWILVTSMKSGDQVALDSGERFSKNGKPMVQVWREVSGGPSGKGFTRGNAEIIPKKYRIKSSKVTDPSKLTPTT